jgi:ubiquinone/menaquinone biosynthesis C-methylase UbiE
MTTDYQQSHPRVGTAEYDEHVREEIEHYGNIFKEGRGRDTLVQPVPASWSELESRANALVRKATGGNLLSHVLEKLQDCPNARMLSIGSGPGGVEIEIAQHARHAEITCADINPELLELGRLRAQDLGLSMTFLEEDFNAIELPPNQYDLVFCHASLHHVIELERLAEQIRHTLRPGARLIVNDVVTRNGYLMWPDTKEVVQGIFRTLPELFRVNHTAYAELRLDDEIWEADTSVSGMECARSEEILPVLARNFVALHYVPYFSISRRFFDTMYGPNYLLNCALDMSVLNWIWELDLHYLATGRLRPETFFGVYTALEA